jgi:hypothetical protein
VWGVLNLIVYFISVVTDSMKPVKTISGFTYIAIVIYQILIWIWLIYIGVQLFMSGQWIFLILYVLIGYGFVATIFGMFQAPFILIPAYFEEKAEGKSKEEEIETAEVLDEEGNVVTKLEGEKTMSKNLARSFLMLYGINLFALILFPVEREGLVAIDYLMRPFYWMITPTLVVGLIYGIYRKIKHKNFFTEDKRHFFTDVWKYSFYIYAVFTGLLFVVALLTDTL